MEKHNNFLTKNKFRLMDESFFSYLHCNSQESKALHSFAIDDALCDDISEDEDISIIRLWTHSKTTVLGIPDSRLPYVEDGIKFLHSIGDDVIIRTSGGLAVALDEGVLNISLIIPKAKNLTIYDCFETMVQFIKQILLPYTKNIEVYEVVGSYCPGDYDLSINGKKFAGISQRRIKNAASVQIYLDICGNSVEKVDRIQKFYKYATRNERINTPPPNVQQEKMASLSDLTNKNITVDEVKQNIQKTLSSFSNDLTIDHQLNKTQVEHYKKRLKQIKQRNELVQQIIQSHPVST